MKNIIPFILNSVWLAGFISCQPNLRQHVSIVITENQNPGTTDWIINKVRLDTCTLKVTEAYTEGTYCRAKEIEGYCSDASILAGDTLNVFVSTHPASSYIVDIYRMGYYQAQGGRHVMNLGPFSGTPQPIPKDGVKNLIECNWEKGFDIVIPDDWVSGVYLGKMTTAPGEWQSYFIFIVKDEREAGFIFQCSDLTWQAYNRWPAWRSLYDWTADWGRTPWFTEPGPDVGFDRPYSFYMNHLPVSVHPITNGSGEFLLWEFPLAYWMEQHGYDVTYISNMDTHSDGEKLLRAKGFISVGHDEYWTQKMFDNVAEARDRGVNLLFLSGNSVSGRIYLNPSGKGQPNRVFGRINWFENESDLMGSKSYGVGLADWKISNPDHWIFRGTKIKKDDIIPDLVGWEFHGYPVGNIPKIQILAEDSLAGAEGKKYAATYYETARGNFVFNAATCWWSMALSTPPGFPFPQNPRKLFTGRTIDFRKNDTRVQSITHNLMDSIVNMTQNKEESSAK